MSALVGTATAQSSKLDATAAQLVSSVSAEVASRAGGYRVIAADVKADESVSVIVTLADNSALAQIEQLGGEILDARANMAVVRLTPLQINSVAALEGVSMVSLGHEARPLLAEARKDAHVDEVQAGEGLDKAYDGSGIICGLMDTGLDVNHVNFFDENGEQRIKRLWVITGANSAVRTYSGNEVLGYTNDTSNETHGSHTLGIMAGSYKDKADQVAIISDRTGRLSIKKDYEVPYYGVATGAELAPCVGTLQDNNIILAVANVADYAKEQGKPAVINLSLGQNIGPHDGTDAVSKYLSELGKEMLVCISAGNEGGTQISLNKKFSAGDTQLKTTFSKTTSVSGMCDIWGNDNTPLNATIVGIDKTTGEIKYSRKLDGDMSSKLITGSYYNSPDYIIDSSIDAVFGERAYFRVTKGVNAANNRYNVYLYVVTQSGANRNVVPGVIIEGTAGKFVDVYAGGYAELLSNGIAGYSDGNDSGSINDMACGDNVLSVGAYVNVSSWPSLGGEMSYQYTNPKGSIADFSSYGTRVDGRQLPLITGPGEAVISSVNYYYYQRGNDGYNGKYIVAKKAANGREYYWDSFSGTSMSSPFVAGVLALWLQAKPDLTMSEVYKILEKTAIKDEYTAAYPERFGYGKINALAGIKEILGSGSVKDVQAEKTVLVSEVSKGVFDIFAPGASSISAALYSLTGAQVAVANEHGENATISADGVAAGVYVLRVTADGKTETRKVAVQ